jgi:tetratricopeptide (TPR) repeat protein
VLIKVADQSELWAEHYEREVAGILALQNEVARRVARALALRLLPAEQARLASARAVIPAAYDAYQKGTQLRQTGKGLDAAERYFRVALEKDPTYAAAWAGIARVWNLRGQGGTLAAPRDAAREAKAAIRKALELDDTDFEAHRALAGVLTYSDWDFPAAEKIWNELLRLDPNDPETLRTHSNFLMIMGRRDEAMAEIERAMELDPLSLRTLSFYAGVLIAARRYDDAITAARQALSLQSDFETAQAQLHNALFLKGSYDEALALDKEAFAQDPELVEELNRGYAEGGYAGAQKGVVRVWTARFGKRGGLPAIRLAARCMHAGDREGALRWLEQAHADGDHNIPYIGGPMYDPLRSDPRYQDLLRRVGLPQ